MLDRDLGIMSTVAKSSIVIRRSDGADRELEVFFFLARGIRGKLNPTKFDYVPNVQHLPKKIQEE